MVTPGEKTNDEGRVPLYFGPSFESFMLLSERCYAHIYIPTPPHTYLELSWNYLQQKMGTSHLLISQAHISWPFDASLEVSRGIVSPCVIKVLDASLVNRAIRLVGSVGKSSRRRPCGRNGGLTWRTTTRSSMETSGQEPSGRWVGLLRCGLVPFCCSPDFVR